MLPPFAEHRGITMTDQVGSLSWRVNQLTSRLGLQYPNYSMTTRRLVLTAAGRSRF
jgi:hypothetical protein